ncbi:Rh family protein/ammonium transporter [Halorhabdus utahensis DSM 12940]|uniref:Ammonium transporter n=1 Tax=Halorhabdus utahensis (strain DSM 12940 / JCM 11049 / AX-2) TaxID=519442 RepID=C7NND6_HALUD|nr:ammonium transporter [Halorhabdus utahensis]ACV11536.1 Rh family protein/ammonium transporter [Halorhabdus utahensis DSM 12940]
MPVGGEVASGVNTVWALVVAFLIFFMQPGFALLESGQVRAKNVGNVLMKNMTDWTLGILSYFIIGFGFSVLIATLTSGQAITPMDSLFGHFGGASGWVGWLVGAVFAMTAATIVSGAVAERMNFKAYVFVAAAMTAVIYPVATGITWDGGLLALADNPANNGFIADIIGVGYQDFAGATVVHMLGGLAGLVGAYMVGPRKGRYDENGNSRPIPGHSMLLAVLGTLFLAFGWYGFNVGTSGIYDGANAFLGAQLGRVALNTTLGMAGGALAAMLVSTTWQGKPDPLWTANGLLAGLVAVTGAVPHVTWWGGLILGSLAGALVLPTFRWTVDTLKIDDVCGVFAVHGMAGAVGTALIPLFAYESGGTMILGDPWAFGGIDALGMQIVGVIVIGIWAVVGSAIAFGIADLLFGLRVTDEEEEVGLDEGEHGVTVYPEFVGGEPGTPGTSGPTVTPDGGELRTDGGRSLNGGDNE